jgi:uncharacterized membrane protein
MRNEELENIVNSSLRTEPGYTLPADFAQKVSFSVARHNQWKNNLYEYFYLSVIVLSLLSVVAGLYYFIDRALILQFLSFISENVIQVVFVVLILNFILFADKVLLPFLFSRWNRI